MMDTVDLKAGFRSRYFHYGWMFGVFFPVFSILLDVLWIHQVPFTLRTVVELIVSQPLHWVIGSAPVFLGGAGVIIGAQYEHLEEINQELESRVEDRVKEINQTRHELELEKLYFESLFDHSPAAIVVLDPSYRVQSVNPAFEELFLYQEDELIGKKLDNLITFDDSSAQAEEYTARVSAGEMIEGIDRRKRKDGQGIDVKILGVPIAIAGEQKGLLGIYHDVTDLLKAKKDAEEADEAKSEFLANMSHEIRTPMNGIMGMIELTLDTDLTAEQREFLTTAQSSAEALLGIINDILDYSKIEAGHLGLEEIEFDLFQTVESVAHTLALRAEEKGLEMTSYLNPDLPSRLVGDPGRLRQILVNLTGNAVKFTDQGEICIRVEPIEETDLAIKLKFIVNDTGIGVPADRQEAIFNRFQQADGSTTRQFGGTGLGLAISSQLSAMMGGEIGLESEFGKGSTFWFTAVFEKLTRGSYRSMPIPLRGVRILGIDDNPTNRLLLEKTLTKHYARIDVIDCCKQTVSILQEAEQSGDPYRIVLLDMQMPGMDGVECLKRVKSDPVGRDLKVIILTSMGRRMDAAQLQDMGAAGYLTKPVKQRKLVDMIGAVLSQESGAEDPGEVRFFTEYTPFSNRPETSRILLAEDNLVNRKVALAMLSKFDLTVHPVENGLEVLEALGGSHFDLVLMDVQMPEMDGLKATEEIRKFDQKAINHGIPVVALTAHAMEGDRERCLEAGMNDYISKPIQPKELAKVLEKWIPKQT